MSNPAVYSKHTGYPSDAVYVGRGSAFGNPFVIGIDGTRDEVIDQFRTWFLSRPRLVAKAKQELAGKDLVCFCAPNRCHADVLLEIANN
jgi:hypothetical protein